MTTSNTQDNAKATKHPKLNNNELRRLKGIGHVLKPIVTIGNKGLTDTVTEEIQRALQDHELIKIKMPAGSKSEREAFGTMLAEKVDAQLINHIGRIALLLRRNPTPNPKLSNLIRYSGE